MDKKSLLSGVIGLVIGCLLTGMVGYSLMPDLMIIEDQSKYDFDESVEKLQESIK